MIMLKQIKKEKQILLHTVFNIRLLNATIYMYQAGFILSVTTNAIDLLKLLPDYDVNFLNSLYFYFFFLFLFFITVRGYNTKELFKYTNQNTSHEERIRLYGRILNEVNRNQSYLEPTLTLKQFSDLLHEDSRLVSQSINQLFGSNFNDFINHHRIELSKQMLATMPGLTIQEIMFQTGFNSKATFNKVFKKHTGMTPTNYKTGHFKG
jgi:AraC-like DNA-binding protein